MWHKLASLRVLEPLLFIVIANTSQEFTASNREFAFCSRYACQVFDFILEEPRLSTRKEASLDLVLLQNEITTLAKHRIGGGSLFPVF
jgi:hypothetical protein